MRESSPSAAWRPRPLDRGRGTCSTPPPSIVNHVLDYIAWALDHEKVEGRGVTCAWLEKDRHGNGCGAMRSVMAKIYLRIFIETLVEDLPDSSIAKQEFRGVLPHFSSAPCLR